MVDKFNKQSQALKVLKLAEIKCLKINQRNFNLLE